MNAYDYLREIKKKDYLIDNKLAELDGLRDLITKTTAVIGSEAVQSSPADKFGKTIAKIIDLEKEINLEIDAFVDDRRQRIKIIEQLEDPMHYIIVFKRYVEYKSFEAIAEEIHYSRPWVSNKFYEAMEIIQKIIDEIL